VVLPASLLPFLTSCSQSLTNRNKAAGQFDGSAGMGDFVEHASALALAG
jgi:hypothetical protein